MSSKFLFDRHVTGIYAVYLASPRTRIGTVTGKAGHWRAETPSGWGLSCYRTRVHAAEALLNQAKTEQRIGNPGTSQASERLIVGAIEMRVTK